MARLIGFLVPVVALLYGAAAAPKPPADDPTSSAPRCPWDRFAADLRTVSQSLYDVFVRMTKYAAASYASQCAMPPNNSTVIKYFDNSMTDTQATLFRDDTRKELTIAFRGTSDLQDFMSDFAQALVPFKAIGINDCPDCMVSFKDVH